MALVKAPLFSFEASGTLKDQIVYSQWKGRNYVRTHTIPFNPNTATQVNVRTAWSLLVTQWQSETPATKLIWDAYAKDFQMSGFNWYVGRGMDAYVSQITTAVTPASVSVTGDPPNEVWVWT